MEVSPNYYTYNQNISYNVKNKSNVQFNNEDSVLEEGIPIHSRVDDAPDDMSDKKYFAAMSAIYAAILNGPEDVRDIMNAYQQIRKGFPEPKTYHSGYDNKIGQHPFSFFRGTVISEYLNPLSEECPNPKLAQKIIEQDKTLWDTKIGKFVQKHLKIETDYTTTKMQHICSLPTHNRFIKAQVIKTNNSVKDIIARAMLRTPKIGLIAAGVVEGIKIIKSVFDGGNFFNEIKNSAISLGTTVTATGILGAIGAKHVGPTGSLVGISLGAIVGAFVDKQLEKKQKKKAVNHMDS